MRLFYQLFLLFNRRPEVWVAAILGKDFHYPIQRDNSGESSVFVFLSVIYSLREKCYSFSFGISEVSEAMLLRAAFF